MNFDNVLAIYDKWLHIEDRDYVPIVYATILANRFDDIPIWLFIIGISSSGKTVMIQNFEGCDEIYTISSLSPNALISGWQTGKKGGGSEDKSLIPQLDRKILLVKDFSTIRELDSRQKNMVLSQLRDAYDGECSRATGLGVKKFKAKFGMIACVTPDYEKQRMLNAMLGERFLTFKLKISSFDKTMEKMIKAVGKKTQMEQEIRAVANEFLHNIRVSTVHKINKSVINEISRLSSMLAVLRSPVSRDTYRRNIDFPAEVMEFPTRVSRNLICLYRGLMELKLEPESRINIIKRIVIDSIPYQRLKVLKCLQNGKSTYSDIKDYVKVSDRTVSEILEEMEMLGILETNGQVYRAEDQYKL